MEFHSILKKQLFPLIIWERFHDGQHLKQKKKANTGSIRIWSYSGPYFPAFGLNTERYSVSLGIRSECGKMRTRITPNTDTFYTVCF